MSRLLLTLVSWGVMAAFLYGAQSGRRDEKRKIAYWEARGKRLKNPGHFKRKDEAARIGMMGSAGLLVMLELFLWHPLVDWCQRFADPNRAFGYALALGLFLGMGTACYFFISRGVFEERDTASFVGGRSLKFRDEAMETEVTPLQPAGQLGDSEFNLAEQLGMTDADAMSPVHKDGAN